MYEDAITAFNNATTIDSKDAKAWNNKGTALRKLGAGTKKQKKHLRRHLK
ncbi:MAG: hypothetical protein C5S38_07835 [Candidatus Methanophagaceae archaeon]|nr:MAG: hypothetical protein C5S38_07835 [Methanophagales archaeon]KAF5433277.1 Flp pilus assembly protein [Methanophagales archaeon]